MTTPTHEATTQKEIETWLKEIFHDEKPIGEFCLKLTPRASWKGSFDLSRLIAEKISFARQEGERAGKQKITEDTSDGYHSFKELYKFREEYNAALFNEWSKQGLYDVHKSHYHHDGERCFGGGWFIVMAQLPTGQISNHYPDSEWDKFVCEDREVSAEWDGHTPQDVLKRLNAFNRGIAKKKWTNSLKDSHDE